MLMVLRRVLTVLFCLLPVGCGKNDSGDVAPPVPQISESGDPLDERLADAEQKLEQGEIDGAIAICDEILAKAPDNQQFVLLRGRAHVAAGQNDLARQDAEAAEK